MSSVLNFSEIPTVEGKSKLVRAIKTKGGDEVNADMWNDVMKFDSDKLEVVMKLASTDPDYELTSFIQKIEYQGFDRLFYIKTALSKMSVSMFCRYAILGAVRGSNFDRIVETCEEMPKDLIAGFTSLKFVKTPKKRDELTILRCTASIPHWCAYYLRQANIAKKLNMSCPAPLQFPGAASLPMSKEVRMWHISFCQSFSALLPGGRFRVTIYMTAMSNLIPVTYIPNAVLELLGVSSASESYRLTDEEVTALGSQLVTKK